MSEAAFSEASSCAFAGTQASERAEIRHHASHMFAIRTELFDQTSGRIGGNASKPTRMKALLAIMNQISAREPSLLRPIVAGR